MKVKSGVKPFTGNYPGKIVKVGPPDTINEKYGPSLPVEWEIVGGKYAGERVEKLFGLREDGAIPTGTQERPSKFRQLWELFFDPLPVPLPDDYEVDEQGLVGKMCLVEVVLNKNGYPKVDDFSRIPEGVTIEDDGPVDGDELF